MSVPTIKTPVKLSSMGIVDADGTGVTCQVVKHVNTTEAALKSLSETLRYSSHPIVKEMVRLGLWRGE